MFACCKFLSAKICAVDHIVNVIMIDLVCLKLPFIDLSEKQSLENAQLRREKAVVEDDLLKSQVNQKIALQMFDYGLIS